MSLKEFALKLGIVLPDNEKLSRREMDIKEREKKRRA